MANRAATLATRTLEKYPWRLFGRIRFTGSGAPVLQTNIDGKGWVDTTGANPTGIVKIQRMPSGNASGDFQIVCADNFVRFNGASFVWFAATSSTDLSAAPVVVVVAAGTDPHASGGATVEFTTATSYAGNTLANPANNAILYVTLEFGDSTAY